MTLLFTQGDHDPKGTIIQCCRLSEKCIFEGSTVKRQPVTWQLANNSITLLYYSEISKLDLKRYISKKHNERAMAT